MFKQIIKIIWHQRRTNGWIFGELLIAIGMLWLMMDILLIDVRTYNLPLGYDIENTWRLKLGYLNNSIEGYVPEEERTTTETEDLMQLTGFLRLNPDIEEVSISIASTPYSWSNMNTSFRPASGDTVGWKTKNYRIRAVTPEYFEVFRITDKHGKPIPPQVEGLVDPIVISQDMERDFFGTVEGKGQKVQHGQGEQEYTVNAVSSPIRDTDYETSSPCVYKVLTENLLSEEINTHGVVNAEIAIRMKRTMTMDEMNLFLESVGEGLTVNNLYVYGASSITQSRKNSLRGYESKAKIKLSLMAFLMVNVFFGIIGTFWLRTQYRKGEVGLRIALGSTKPGLFRYFNNEGIALLMLTFPVMVLLIGNLFYLDMVEVSRMPFTITRVFTVSLGSYLLMAGIICLGIWFPARKAMALPPAEALHYE